MVNDFDQDEVIAKITHGTKGTITTENVMVRREIAVPKSFGNPTTIHGAGHGDLIESVIVVGRLLSGFDFFLTPVNDVFHYGNNLPNNQLRVKPF